MGIFKSVGGAIAYPFSRAYNDISGSLGGIRQSYQDMVQARRQKHADYEAARKALGDMSERERFEQVYEMNGWNEQELQEQAKASRRTRITLLCTAAVGLVVIVALLWLVQWWVMMILGPVGIVYLAACAALSIKFAWYEYQIETRSIIPIKAFLARPDLFARMFG